MGQPYNPEDSTPIAPCRCAWKTHDPGCPWAPPPTTDPSSEALMPKDVPGAGEFRDAFKKAVPPRGADTASWVNGYCAGWTACDAALLRDATARDAIAAERDRCAALLRQMAIARGDLDERLVLQYAARCVEKCPACEGCGMDADGAPCKSCAETAT